VTDNPFKPPDANVETPELKRGSAVKAVVVGLAVDLGGTMAFAVLFGIAHGIYLLSSGETPEHIQSAKNAFGYDTPLGILGFIIGCLFSVLGGYVCARIARYREYRLGLVMCAASLVVVAFTGVGDDEVSAGAAVGLVLISLASILVGIHIGVLQNRRAARA